MMQIFVVRDAKAQTYGNPFFFPSVGVALRSVSDEVNKGKESILAMHPEDFELFHVGEFDDASCLFKLFPAPKPLTVCSGLKLNGSASNA